MMRYFLCFGLYLLPFGAGNTTIGMDFSPPEPCVDLPIHMQVRRTIYDSGVKYPEVVFAQAVLETGFFSSKIFLENHNLFGMKLAKTRPTTAKGKRRHHAYYKNWEDSVYDYLIWQSYWIGAGKINITSQDAYISTLHFYATDNLYQAKIKELVIKYSFNGYEVTQNL